MTSELRLLSLPISKKSMKGQPVYHTWATRKEFESLWPLHGCWSSYQQRRNGWVWKRGNDTIVIYLYMRIEWGAYGKTLSGRNLLSTLLSVQLCQNNGMEMCDSRLKHFPYMTINQVSQHCPLEALIPPVRLTPKTPYPKVYHHYRGRIQPKHVVLSESLIQMSIIMQPYFTTNLELVVKFWNMSTLICIDDKHRIKVGEPEYSVTAVKWGRWVLGKCISDTGICCCRPWFHYIFACP